MKLKATIISIVSVLIIGLTAILLYCFWPAIKGTVDNSKYYTQKELQESYDKGYNDGCKTETELTGQVKYYKSLVDEYYIQVNTLNDEITMLTKTKKDYETQISNIESQKANLHTQVDNLKTIKTNNETTINNLKNQILNLQEQIAVLSNDKTSLESQISELQTQVEDLQSKTEDLTETKVNNEAQINNLNTQITNLQNEITEKNNLIWQKNKTISSLNTQVSQLQTVNELNTQIINNLNAQIIQLNNQVSNLATKSQNYSNQISLLNNKINQLQDSLTYYENFISNLQNGDKAVATFEYDGSVYNIQIVNKGSKLSVTTPTSTDYKIFNGWKTSDGESVDFETYTITANTKFIADITYKFDVKFIVENSEYNSQLVVKNAFATKPENPTKTNYSFVGWSIDGINIVSNIESLPVTNNTTYIAIFKEDTIKINNNKWYFMTYNSESKTTTNVGTMINTSTNEYVMYLPLDLTVETLKSQFSIPSGKLIIVKDKDENVLADDDYLGSFSYMQIGDVVVRFIVLGDVNGDGVINMMDRAKLNSYVKALDSSAVCDYADSYKWLCMDLNFDGQVTEADNTILNNYSSGIAESFAELFQLDSE